MDSGIPYEIVVYDRLFGWEGKRRGGGFVHSPRIYGEIKDNASVKRKIDMVSSLCIYIVL